MKVDALAQLGAQLARGAGALSFADDGGMGARLTLGQIIKGRVLRSYEGGRHLVDFDGQQRIVDSAVPLRADEVFHGRVLAIGEKVQLQKLASPTPQTDSTAVPPKPRDTEATLAALFERYRAQVPPAQLDSTAALVARLPQPQHAALAALVLAKLGLPLEPAWIRALHARLNGERAGGAQQPALRLETAAAQPALLDTAVQALAAAMAGLMSAPPASPETAATTAAQPSASPVAALAADGAPPQPKKQRGQSPPDFGARDTAQRILNLPTPGAVAHRLGTLALVVDGRLLELDVALFDEAPDDAAPDPMRHRQIVIALETAALGRVEVRAQMVGTRMQLTLATTTSEQTLALSLHSQHLRQALQALDWQLDSLNYVTQHSEPRSGAVHSVVEHIINPGSVSRIV